MALDFLTASGSSSFATIFFTQLLGLIPCLGNNAIGCYSGNVINDLVWGFLVPHVVLLGLIVSFVAATKNSGVRILLGVTTYIVIMVSGAYSFLAPLTGFMFVLLLIVNFTKLILSKFVHPQKATSYFQRGTEKRLVERAKQEKKQGYKDQLDHLNDLKARLEVDLRDAKRAYANANTPDEKKDANHDIKLIRKEIVNVEKDIASLKREMRSG